MSQENANSNKETFEKILNEVLEISKISYDQENDRAKQLLNKSDYLIKYISTITIFVNIFFPLAFNHNILSFKILILIYVILSIPLILSLFYSVRAQILRPGEFFPTGRAVLQKIKNKEDGFKNNLSIKNKSILYYSTSTEHLQESNDKKAKFLKRAYKQYILSIIILVIAVLIIMILAA